ncbi:hypothetical protein CR513_56569, partial [Mucuna pruriens]
MKLQKINTIPSERPTSYKRDRSKAIKLLLITPDTCHSIPSFHTPPPPSVQVIPSPPRLLEMHLKIRKIKLVLVKLPNGSKIVSHFARMVFFSSQFNLTNVLFIVGFKFNLISVSKLVNTSSCKLTFSNSFCHIKDLNSLKTIVETQFEVKIKSVRSNNGVEFKLKRICHHLSCMVTPQQNEIVER